MTWTISMEDEKDQDVLLTEGWHEAEIKKVVLVSKEESGSGNPYFQWTLETQEGFVTMRTTLIKGKRWLLKQTLSACGIEAKQDDPKKKYSFSADFVEGKTVMIKIKNKTEEFTGSDGNLRTKENSEVKAVKKVEGKQAKQKTKETVEDDTVPF